MLQIKEEDKPPEKELNNMETSNLPNTEFKALVIKLFMISVRTSTKN